MFARWSVRLGLACSLASYPLALQGQDKSLQQRIADDFIALAGGVHPGYRIAHAKGIVLTGTFAPSRGATSLSRAPHLVTASTPVIARYSNGSGVPDVADNSPHAVPRGLALRFQLPNGAYTDIVANSHNGFVVGTGEDFAAFLDAVLATKPDSKHPSPIEAFLGTHPAALKFVTDPARVPVSFATEGYYGNDAFIFVNAQNVKQPGRYRLVPVGGPEYLDSAAAAKVSANYLFDELTRRLAKQPVKVRVLVQLPNPGDPTSDASVVWPDDRKLVELGVVTLTTVAPDNAEVSRKLQFNPIFLSDGIQLSDDPLPPLRSAVYALSVANRRSPSPAAPATAQQRNTAQQQNVEPTWLSFDPAAKTVRFQLIAGLTGLNGALNFNGFRDGQLTLVVPVGWQTEIDFRNHDGVLPHSAEVIAPQAPPPALPGDPAIPRAFTLKLLQGLPSEATDDMRFAAQPAGDYLIACGVPGHGAAGMWIRLRVSGTAKTPELLPTLAVGSR